MAFRGVAADGGHLGVRRERGGVSLDADLLRRGGGGLFAVPREHDRANLRRVQGGEGGAARFPDPVDERGADGDGSVGGPDLADDGARGYGRRRQRRAADEFTGSHAPAGAGDRAGDALAWGIRKPLDGQEAGAFELAGADDPGGEGMRGRRLQGLQGAQGASAVGVRREDFQGRHLRDAGGQRARLVEADAVHVGQAFHGGAAAEEDALAGAGGDGREDRGGHGED